MDGFRILGKTLCHQYFLLNETRQNPPISHAAKKPVIGVSDKIRHKLGCAATEDGYRLENFGFTIKRLFKRVMILILILMYEYLVQKKRKKSNLYRLSMSVVLIYL